MPTTIKRLDPITVTKIAAGEVIDRPASIVKELIENCLDAGATYIRVEVEDGGKRLIRITDNGHGMSKDDLVLAPLRHTTSKISKLEDLYETDTFGFRGEALASVCHVANVTLTSRQADGQAYKISVHHDTISEPIACAAPIGTTIDVQDLFFDIPVRQRFLKSGSTELSYITENVIHFALSHPDVDFTLISNGQDIVNSTGISDAKALLVHFYGKNLRNALVPINAEIGPLRFSGFMSDPSQTFSNRSKQIITVNGRLVKSPTIQKALSESTKDILPAKRYPMVLLHIHTDGQSVDVNIHPQKHDVKFINPGFLFDALPKALMISLQSHDRPIHALHTFAADQQKPSFVSNSNQPNFSQHQNQNLEAPINQKQVITASSFFNPAVADTSIPMTPTFAESNLRGYDSTSEKDLLESPLPTSLPLQGGTLNNAGGDLVGSYFQLFNTYIGIPTSKGLYLLDQHAVHERILYEEIKDNFGKQSAKQPLLISEVVDVSADLMAVYEDAVTFFTDLNFVIEPFGPTSLVVREVPLSFADSNCSELIVNILTQLKLFPGSSRNLTLDQKETLQMRACKAAIKAGKKMHLKEVEQLVKDVLRSPSNYTCPHGRPLCVFLDKSQLERMFLRS